MKINKENINEYISQMSIEEKVGQICVPILQSSDIPAEIEKAICEYGVGMLRYCPNANFDNSSVPIDGPNRYLKPSETAELMNKTQELAQKTRLKIPLIIAVDQEGSTRSDVNRGGATVYPAHMAFGAIDDIKLTYEAARVCALEFKAMGINLVQAPIVDVITYEGRKTIKASSFGQSVELVENHSLAMLKGFKDGGIAAMVKHFPGYGSIATDAHKGVAEITKSLDKLESEDLAPIRKVFAEGADGIMTGHVITKCLGDDNLPATLSRKIITDVIRKKMGYDGIVETDAMRMKSIQDLFGTGQASVMAVKAGCDLVLLRGDFEHFMDGYAAILEAAKSGEIDGQEINEAVRRILTVKLNIKLFDNPFVDPKEADKIVGQKEHRKVSKEVAKRSVSLVKNEKKLIPLDNNTNKKILAINVEPQKIAAAMDAEQSANMLIKAIKAANENTQGYMTKLNPTQEDIANTLKLSESADIIIVGTCNVMLYNNQSNLVEALIATGKKVIVVAMESPFDIEELVEVENYICTFGVSNDSMIAVADLIFGKLDAVGKIPVKVNY